jgi:hypothetical protein
MEFVVDVRAIDVDAACIAAGFRRPSAVTATWASWSAICFATVTLPAIHFAAPGIAAARILRPSATATTSAATTAATGLRIGVFRTLTFTTGRTIA